MYKSLFVGVDVGSTSVRAGLITSDGYVVKKQSRELRIWKPGQDFYEQSSKDIWTNLCAAVKVSNISLMIV